MFNHVFMNVSDLKKSAKFYESTLSAIGIEVNLKHENCLAFGNSTQKYLFWINQTKSEPTKNMHLAFNANSKDEVIKFFEAALAYGGTSNGGPGVRSEHGPNYFAAYVRDLDGNNIEAVYNK